MLAEIQQKLQGLVDGAILRARATKDGSMATQDAHARYLESVYQGNVFAVANQAGVTSQAGLSATTPVLTLYNPKGNNKNAVILFAGAILTVAPATAGAVWVAVNNNVAAAAVTGTAFAAGIVTNCLVGNANQPSIIPLLAATLPAAPIAIATLGVNFTGAITTIPQTQTLGRWFDGSIVLAPGSALSIQTGVASGASGLFCEYIWEEVNV